MLDPATVQILFADLQPAIVARRECLIERHELWGIEP